ncbi:hypothetical protein [Schleiferilactobacillus harbinensis]|uniref:hypothetical protein n=1 Tax=Schleiferilactobacillus harbinensis TaxID=304207 RepID=UPI0039EBC0AC
MTHWLTHMVEVATLDATSASKDDVAAIGRQVGYEWLNIYRYNGDYESDQAVDSRIDGITAAVAAGDFLVYQYPSLNGPRFETRFIDRMKMRGANVVLFVHDVEILRGSNVADGFDEYNYLNKADALIVHNPVMAKVLHDRGVTVPMIPLYLFDALDDFPLSDNAPSRQLVFAGNLAKSNYLADWAYRSITVFGAAGGSLWEKLTANPQVDFRGALYREQLNAAIGGDGIGLVWDVNTPEGNYADYARFNNPYKLSFYLGHGMPVIIPQEAAAAKFVTANKLGFALSSLADIDPLLADLADADLAAVTANARHIAALLRVGYFTKRALLKAEQTVKFGPLKLPE